MYFPWRRLKKSTTRPRDAVEDRSYNYRGFNHSHFLGLSPFRVRNINLESDDLAYVDSTLLCPISLCVITKDTDALKKIICDQKEKPTKLQADKRGWTAVHVAAFKDEHADFLELLLSNKDTLQLNLDAKTLTGKTALYLACFEGCPKNCRILLEGGCNAEIQIAGCSLLHTASKRGHAGIVSELIAHGMDPNCQDDKKNTPLHWASLHGNVEVVRELMTKKKTKIKISNDSGYLPLHEACRHGSLEIVKILLEADRSLVNKCSDFGVTPLISAIEGRHVDCVKYLLDHGADANRCTVKHQTILHYAARSGIPTILELVLQKASMKYIREKFTLQMTSYISTQDTKFHSLMPYVIASSSPECMLLLLKSSIPKVMLETPYIYGQRYCVYEVYSPLSYLFQAEKLDNCTVDKLLQLLLQYNITDLHEFSRMFELKNKYHWSIQYVHPFSTIFEGSWYNRKRDLKSDHYLNILLEYGITTDYCLQYDGIYKGRFMDFDKYFFERFYKPVIWAIENDKAEFIELLLIHSAILEPSHLWNFLQYKRSDRKEQKNPQNVVNYLIDLGVTVDTSNLPSYPFGGTIKCPNLQQLCRQVIRKHLRDVTMRDNLKNFKQKINALPLPNLLKDYLNFKRR